MLLQVAGSRQPRSPRSVRLFNVVERTDHILDRGGHGLSYGPVAAVGMCRPMASPSDRADCSHAVVIAPSIRETPAVDKGEPTIEIEASGLERMPSDSRNILARPLSP